MFFGWEAVTVKKIKVPQTLRQKNGYDCGIYTLCAAEWLVCGRPFPATLDCEYERQSLAYELAKHYGKNHQASSAGAQFAPARTADAPRSKRKVAVKCQVPEASAKRVSPTCVVGRTTLLTLCEQARRTSRTGSDDLDSDYVDSSPVDSDDHDSDELDSGLPDVSDADALTDCDDLDDSEPAADDALIFEDDQDIAPDELEGLLDCGEGDLTD